MPTDLLITDALVVDGTGAPGRRADVAVTGDRIVAITPAGTANRRGRTIRRGRAGAGARLHRHARALRPADPGRPRPSRQGEPGRHLRGARPGRAVLRAGRRRHGTGPARPSSPAGTTTRPGSASDWRGVAEYLDRLDARDRLQRRLPGAAGHGPDAGGGLGRTGRRPAPSWTRMREVVATGSGRGRRRAVVRADLHARHVRRHRRAGGAVRGGGRARRATTPAPPQLRRRRAGGVRGDGRRRPALRLRPAPAHATLELRGERGPGR